MGRLYTDCEVNSLFGLGIRCSRYENLYSASVGTPYRPVDPCECGSAGRTLSNFGAGTYGIDDLLEIIGRREYTEGIDRSENGKSRTEGKDVGLSQIQA